MCRACQRDVEETHALGGDLGEDPGVDRHGLRIALVRRREVEHRIAVVVVLAHIGSRLPVTAFEEERAEDDRVFEPLRLVDRDDLHEVAIGFEPQLARRRRARARCAAVASQRSSASGAMPDAAASCSCSPRCSRFVMRRSPSLRASMRGDYAFAGDQPPVHHGEPARPPQRAIFDEAIDMCGKRGVVVRQRRDGSGVLSEDLRRQRRTHEVRARRLEHRGEHARDLVGVGRAEDALLRELDAADAERGERVLHVDALRVRAHEDGDVGRAQRHVVEADPLLRGLAQQPRDLRRRGAHCGGLRIGAQHRRAVCGRRQHPDGERRARRGVVRERRAMARPRGHRAIVELGERKGARVRAEQRVLRGDQRRCRALVLEQRVVRLRARAALRNTRAGRRCGSRRSPASDRRRGTPARRCPGRSLEDRELQRIGVLELVDQRGGILRAQAVGQSRMARGFRARHGGCAAGRRSRRRAASRLRLRTSAGASLDQARGSVRDAHGPDRFCSARRVSRNSAGRGEERMRRRRAALARAFPEPCRCQQIELVVLRVRRQRIARARARRPNRANARAIAFGVVDVPVQRARSRRCAKIAAIAARCACHSALARAIAVGERRGVGRRRVDSGGKAAAAQTASPCAARRCARTFPANRAGRSGTPQAPDRSRPTATSPSPEVVDDVLQDRAVVGQELDRERQSRRRTACRRARGSRTRES